MRKEKHYVIWYVKSTVIIGASLTLTTRSHRFIHRLTTSLVLKWKWIFDPLIFWIQKPRYLSRNFKFYVCEDTIGQNFWQKAQNAITQKIWNWVILYTWGWTGGTGMFWCWFRFFISHTYSKYYLFFCLFSSMRLAYERTELSNLCPHMSIMCLVSMPFLSRSVKQVARMQSFGTVWTGFPFTYIYFCHVFSEGIFAEGHLIVS